MVERAELLKEIDNLSSDYLSEVLNFVGYLRQKAQIEKDDEVDAYKAMAADTEREQEAREWCNAYFGPAGIKWSEAVFGGLNLTPQ